MSRGLGKRQRYILDELQQRQHKCCWIVDLLPPGYTRSEYNAMYRAARSLLERGRISIFWFAYGKETVALCLDGVDPRPILRPCRER